MSPAACPCPCTGTPAPSTMGECERTRSFIASRSALANEKRLFLRPRTVSSPPSRSCVRERERTAAREGPG